jgi:hypothetical protein
MKGVLRLMCVLWPSFLAACALEMLVFGLVDPGDLHWPVAGGAVSRQAVYALGFFAFWAATAASSALTAMLIGTPPLPQELRRTPSD